MNTINNYYIVLNYPIGDIILISDGKYLTSLTFSSKESLKKIEMSNYQKDENLEIFKITDNWLKRYFNKEYPDINELNLKLNGTDFSKRVWDILKTIAYGNTLTYGDIANIIASERGISKMSAQAAGQAVGRNPIPIIIPCHRVLGTNSKLTGYSAGIERKIYLLNHENIKFKK